MAGRPAESDDDGKLTNARISLYIAEHHPTEYSAQHIGSMRPTALAFGGMLADGRRVIANMQGQVRPFMQEILDANPELAAALPTGLIGPTVEVGKSQRGKRLSTDDRAAVAEVYEAAWNDGNPVNRAIRDAFNLSEDGAAKRIMKARKAGHLDGIGPKR